MEAAGAGPRNPEAGVASTSPWGEHSPLVNHMARKAFNRLLVFLKKQHGMVDEGRDLEDIVAAKSWPNRLAKAMFGGQLPDLVNYGIIEDNGNGTWTFNIGTLRPDDNQDDNQDDSGQ